jgi:hypothetical protein
MKEIFALLAVFSCMTASASSQDAIAYNDSIVNEQNKITKAMIEFSALPSDTALENVRRQAHAGLLVLNGMSAFDGNPDLLNRAKDLFTFYSNISINEYTQILTLLLNKDQYTFEELSGHMKVYVDAISVREKPLDEAFHAAQLAFAQHYGFVLQNNSVQDQVDAAGAH